MWDWWWIEDGHDLFDSPPTDMGDLCLLLFNLGPVTVWPIEYTGNDAAPVSGSRLEEIGIFYFLSVEIFTLGTHLPCCKEAPSHMESHVQTTDELPAKACVACQPRESDPISHPLSLQMTRVLAFVWLQPHESPPPTWKLPNWAQPTYGNCEGHF